MTDSKVSHPLYVFFFSCTHWLLFPPFPSQMRLLHRSRTEIRRSHVTRSAQQDCKGSSPPSINAFLKENYRKPAFSMAGSSSEVFSNMLKKKGEEHRRLGCWRRSLSCVFALWKWMLMRSGVSFVHECLHPGENSSSDFRNCWCFNLILSLLCLHPPRNVLSFLLADVFYFCTFPLFPVWSCCAFWNDCVSLTASVIWMSACSFHVFMVKLWNEFPFRLCFDQSSPRKGAVVLVLQYQWRGCGLGHS